MLAELVPFGDRFNFTIFELSSQNRDFNSLLCEIFTNLAVKFEKSGTQLILRNELSGQFQMQIGSRN